VHGHERLVRSRLVRVILLVRWMVGSGVWSPMSPGNCNAPVIDFEEMQCAQIFQQLGDAGASD